MHNKIFLIVISFTFLTQSGFADMLLFVSDDCPHCQTLEKELYENNFYNQSDIQRFEVSKSEENRDLYRKKTAELNYKDERIPLLINDTEFRVGKSAIIEYLKSLQAYSLTNTLGQNTLSGEDSENLKDMLKTDSLRVSTSPIHIDNGAPISPPPEEKNSQTKIIGLIAIIFGLTLFGAIMWRAKRRK